MQLRTEVEIDREPEQVWQVLSDFRRYAEWNPFIQSVDGELAVGARLAVIETPPNGSERSYRATLTVLDPGRELRWLGKFWVSGLFDGERFVQLRATNTGGTRVVNAGDFRGFLVKHMGNALTQTARGLVGMNEALKRRVERGATR
jgi:hypothetical protein